VRYGNTCADNFARCEPSPEHDSPDLNACTAIDATGDSICHVYSNAVADSPTGVAAYRKPFADCFSESSTAADRRGRLDEALCTPADAK
jgi:hypothetical protein